jgi:hypothetical protein
VASAGLPEVILRSGSDEGSLSSSAVAVVNYETAVVG